MKDFNKFMSQLQETNQTLDFFCDFDKIAANVDNIKLSLCMLNSMIGTADLRKSVETIWNRDRTAFSVMDILIAVRSEGKKRFLIPLVNVLFLISSSPVLMACWSILKGQVLRICSVKRR